MRRLFLLLIISAFSLSLVFSQSGGSRRYVAVESATVKSSNGFFSQDRGTLPLGTEVTVVRDDGKWTEIRAGNLTGWVAAADLSTRKIIASTSSVTPGEVALAGKGFSPAVEEEYRKNGPDYSAVDVMERMDIPATELLRFITEGRLAGGE